MLKHTCFGPLLYITACARVATLPWGFRPPLFPVALPAKELAPPLTSPCNELVEEADGGGGGLL